MPTPLKPIGPPTVGTGIAFGIKATANVPAATRNNRIITRDYEMRVEDQSTYVENIDTPTLYDPVYPNAVLVDQSVAQKGDDRAVCRLRRVFAEIPFEWNERVERVETFFGVAQSQLYQPSEFQFRTGLISLRCSCRVNRRYYLSSDAAQRVGEFPRFVPVDAEGVAVNVMTDYTTPSADEYIAMVLGRQEVVVSSVPRRWMGAIYVLETVYAAAK